MEMLVKFRALFKFPYNLTVLEAPPLAGIITQPVFLNTAGLSPRILHILCLVTGRVVTNLIFGPSKDRTLHITSLPMLAILATIAFLCNKRLRLCT